MNWLKAIGDFFANLFKSNKVTVDPLPKVNSPTGLVALSWELPCNDGQVSQGAKPERKAWTEKLILELDKQYDLLMTAKDLKSIHPKFMDLTRAQRVAVLAELMSTVAEYESSWNPNTSTKDVNGRTESQYKATGLFQMNAADDQRNYRTKTNYTHEQLKNPLINIEVGVKILATVVDVRGKITFSNSEKSPILRFFYATLVTDTAYGSKTLVAAKKRINELVYKMQQGVATAPNPPATTRKTPKWFVFAKQFEGKKETDPAFAKIMVPKWKLFGMDLGTISQNWAAWCGLATAVALSGVGYDYQKNGALAKNWDQYGQVIEWRTEGIPQGAIVRINHDNSCAQSSSNHVSMAEGDCTPADLTKSGATITLYGGNQGNTWKKTDYSVKEICAVRWPKEEAKPGKILKSVNCSNSKSGSESTR